LHDSSHESNSLRQKRSAGYLGCLQHPLPGPPHPIGLHRVQVVAAEGLRILVRPLEALDQTPVIDVKPVLGDAAER
jgi:tRNA (Thr-GGU) A37 N-methylase